LYIKKEKNSESIGIRQQQPADKTARPPKWPRQITFGIDSECSIETLTIFYSHRK